MGKISHRSTAIIKITVKAKNCIKKVEQTLNHKNKTIKKIAIEVLPLTNFIQVTQNIKID
jgi:hypothetical protein